MQATHATRAVITPPAAASVPSCNCIHCVPTASPTSSTASAPPPPAHLCALYIPDVEVFLQGAYFVTLLEVGLWSQGSFLHSCDPPPSAVTHRRLFCCGVLILLDYLTSRFFTHCRQFVIHLCDVHSVQGFFFWLLATPKHHKKNVRFWSF